MAHSQPPVLRARRPKPAPRKHPDSHPETALSDAGRHRHDLPARRIALLIEYDGTDFVGWQMQTNGRSVQAVVESIIVEALGRRARIVGSGRTDSGVHALGQVAHFDLRHAIPTDRIREALNCRLPPDVQIRAAVEVDAEWHARRDARMRRYVYILADGVTKPVLDRRRIAWTPYPLDAKRMAAAAQSWIGKHDFTSFRAQKCQAESPIRSIDLFSVERIDAVASPLALAAAGGSLIAFTVEARAFLHHQVRNMVGTLIEIGRGAEEISWAKKVLSARDRSAAGRTMAAEGLILERVAYREKLWG
jgi:tRNA pseudouridine38-40 synthase